MKTDVLIVGAGPTGLMLANELRLAGVDALVVERAAVRSGQSKALNLQPRTAEVLDMRGLLEPLLPKAMSTIADGHFAGLSQPLYYDGWQTRHPYQVGIAQARTEAHLEEEVTELVRRGHALTGLTQHADHVVGEVEGLGEITARYLVACDGGRSTVRKLVGTPFDGRDARMQAMVADLSLNAADGLLPTSWRSMREAFGSLTQGSGWLLPLEGGRYRGLFFGERQRTAGRDEPVTAEEVRTEIKALYGDAVSLVELHHASRFTDANRQVRDYRDGRVFYAGDAAHVHLPAGGQGLNLGVQDAFNLGWKLAAVLRGEAGDALLDSYHAERHPVGARVLHNTRAQGVLMGIGQDPDGIALRETFVDMMRIPQANHYLAGMISGLDIHYGEADSLVGARIPDHDLADGSRLYERLHSAGWVSVTRDDAADLEADAVLLRPDGYVYWAGDRSGLDQALATRFGLLAAAN